MTLEQTKQTLLSFLQLKEGWDSYGAKPIDPSAIAAGQILAFQLGDGWQAVPCSDGGVQLEGNVCGCPVEIRIGRFGE